MLNGQYFHKGYVTRDLAKASDALSSLYGMTFSRFEADGDVQTDGGGDKANIKIALGWHDNLEYELIEPVSGFVDFYRDYLPDDDMPRLHHVGVLVDDWDALETDVAAKDLPVIMSGAIDGLKFAYVDVREPLGHYVEYMWMRDDVWAERSKGRPMPVRR